MRFPRFGCSCSAATTALVLLLASSPVSEMAGASHVPPGSRPDPATRAARDREEASEGADVSHETEFFRNLVGGEIDAQRMRQMWKEALALRSEAPAATNAVNSWQLVGPLYSINPGGGNMTGRVRDIDARNVRVLAASGGLWRFNFGAVPMTETVPSTWYGTFATSPFDANTILLGTGEYKFGVGTGLYKTTDGGATWVHKTTSPEPQYFSRIRYSPDGTVVHAATFSGYYRSTNGGETWSRTMTGAITDLSTLASYPNLVLATQANNGLWRSVDAGVTWGHLVSGGIPVSGTGDGAVSAVAGPAGQVWIYVCFDVSVFRSTDGGGTWTDITPPYGIGNSGYGPVISACPGDPNTVLMGNVSYNRTTTGGAIWSKIATAHLHADYHAFAWDDDGVGVWAGNDGGWSHSADRGLTWDSSANVMPISQFYNIDCEKTEVGYMIGGTQDNNVLLTPNEALFWSDPAVNPSSEGDAFGVCIDQYNPSHMWAISGLSNGAYAFPRVRTLDGGVTWQPVNNGIDPNSFAGVIRTDNAFPVRLVTSVGAFVYESTNEGTTWTKSNAIAFPTNITNLTSSIRVAPSAVLYATLFGSTPGQRLYVRDGGNWSERSSGLPTGSVLKVVPHPWFAYADEAWAIMSGFSTQKLLHTPNRGVTWTDVTGDFPPSVPITDVLPNPRNSSELYVGSLLGCYRSTNGGVNWERWNNGMSPAVKVTELSYIDLTPSTGQVFVVAGTYGRSVWKRDVSGTDPQPTLQIGDRLLAEENSGVTTAWFGVTLSAPQPTTVLVDYTTMDSTATVADNDYVSTSGTLVFTAGQTIQWITVPVNGDTQIEPNETFKVVLSNPIRATVANYGVGTILDDDAHALVCQDLFVANGAVSTVVSSGNTIYIGGGFSRVGPASGSAVPIDAASGQPVWLPKVAGYVNTVAPDGSGGWFLGGNFTHVGGVARPNLAHVLANHTLADWNPAPNGGVLALVVSGGAVYAGGWFTSIAGVARNHIAALDAASGVASDWNPDANNLVVCMALSGGTLYAGGDFTTMGGLSRVRIAALNSATGLPSAWNPNANNEVYALAVDGGTVYAAGFFTTIGGQNRNYIAALDATSGAATGWDPNADGPLFALAVDGATVYAGGAFSNIGGQPRLGLAALDAASGLATTWAPNLDGGVLTLAVSGPTVYVGGGFTTIGGQPRNNLAALDAASGLATSWNPDPDNSVAKVAVDGGTVLAAGGFTSLAAQPRNNIAALDAVTGMVTPWNPGAGAGVNALAVSGGTVYAGGGFTTIGGQTRNRIAALDAVTGLATTWDPNANSTVRALLLSGSIMYVGGNFTTIGGQTRERIAALSTSTGMATNWNPDANPGQHGGIVSALATDGTVVYAGGLFGIIGGQARNGLAQLSATTGAASPTWNPNPNGTVSALVLNGSALYVGGSFTQVGGLTRRRVALLAASTGAVGVWNPDADDDVYALALNGSNMYVGGAFSAIGGQARSHLAEVSRFSTGLASDWVPNPDGDVTALAVNGSAIYAGGAFVGMGGLPQAHIACLIPTSLVDVPPAEPIAEFALHLGPNPTTGRVLLEYTLPQAARVRIGVYDVQGRKVASPIDALQPAGKHEATWDGTSGPSPVPPGLYFVRFEADARQALRRFVIVR